MISPLYLFTAAGHNSARQPIDYDSECSMKEILDDEEKRVVEQIWNTPYGPASKGWKSNPIGWLCDTTNGLKFGRSEYSIYLALALQTERFSERVRNSFCGAVGCAVTTADDYVVVQQRAAGLLAPSLFDSSAAGMIIIQNGQLNIEAQMEEKLCRELSLDSVSFQFTGVHGSRDYVSAQVTYACKVPLNFLELKEKANPRFTERIIGVNKRQLGDFLVSHYVADNSPKVIGDGVGVFLASMEPTERDYYITLLNQRGAKISRAVLRDEEIELID